MSAETISKLTKLIVFLVFMILGLIGFIVFDKMQTAKVDNEQLGFCATADSTNIKMESKAAYRYSANFINADFNPENGRNIFKDKCAACHSQQQGTIIVGPALFNLFQHIPHKPQDWLFHYLSNSDSLASANDAYVKSLREKHTIGKWNHTDSLISKSEMIDLVGYIGMIK